MAGDEPEPEPAPLQPVTPKPPEPSESRPVPATPASHSGRASSGVAWGGAAVSLALFTVGTVFGVLSQQRSDALSRSTASVGLPPIYDEAQRIAYTDLQTQGQTYSNISVACYFAGGATALASAILFWNAARLTARDKKIALIPTVAPRSGSLTLVGSF